MRVEQRRALVEAAAAAQDERERAPRHADAVVVAERVGDLDGALRQPLGPRDVTRHERAVRLERQQRGGDAAVAVGEQSRDRCVEDRVRLLVAVAEVEDDRLQPR